MEDCVGFGFGFGFVFLAPRVPSAAKTPQVQAVSSTPRPLSNLWCARHIQGTTDGVVVLWGFEALNFSKRFCHPNLINTN